MNWPCNFLRIFIKRSKSSLITFIKIWILSERDYWWFSVSKSAKSGVGPTSQISWFQIFEVDLTWAKQKKLEIWQSRPAGTEIFWGVKLTRSNYSSRIPFRITFLNLRYYLRKPGLKTPRFILDVLFKIIFCQIYLKPHLESKFKEIPHYVVNVQFSL